MKVGFIDILNVEFDVSEKKSKYQHFFTAFLLCVLQFGSLVATMHEIIVTTLTHQAFVSEELFKEAGNNPWIQEQCQNKTQCTPHGDLGTFLERSIHEWFKQCTLDSSDEGIVHGLYDAVVGIKQPNAQHGQTKQVSKDKWSRYQNSNLF